MPISHTNRRAQVIGDCDGVCVFCGLVAPPQYLCVDHIMPVSLGGSDDQDNWQILCWWCNAKKHNRIVPFQMPLTDPYCYQCKGRYGHTESEHPGGLTYRAKLEGVL